MCEYSVLVKYADNKICRDNHFIGEEIQRCTITTDLDKAKEYLDDILKRIELCKKIYPNSYSEESAKLMVREVSPWCKLAIK